MNTIIICPKEVIHFSNEFFSSRVSKYPSSFSFISKEKGFSFFLPGDRPKPGIRRRYSAHFSYWRDTRGWTPGSHFQLHRQPRLIRIRRVLCKFQAVGRTGRNYRPLRPRFLGSKGSLHSGSLPSAKHNRSVSHCELTSHQFISSYAYTRFHRVLYPPIFFVCENKRRILPHLCESLLLESTSVTFALLRKSKFSIQICIFMTYYARWRKLKQEISLFISVSLDWFCLQIVVSSRNAVVEKLDNEFFNSWLMANVKTRYGINKRYDAIVKELAMST